MSLIASSSSEGSAPQSLDELIIENQGVVIGEEHNDRASSQYLIESCEKALKQGVKYLFLEDLERDLYQGHIDAYQANPNEEMPKPLENALRFKDIICAGREHGLGPHEVKQIAEDLKSPDPAKRAHAEQMMAKLQNYEKKQRYNRTELFKKASQLRIKIQLIDTSEMKHLNGKERLQTLNEYACKIIHNTVVDHSEKYIVLVGKYHAVTQLKVPGLRERLKAPLVQVDTNTGINQRRQIANMIVHQRSQSYKVNLQVFVPKAIDPTDITSVNPSSIEDNGFFG